MSSYTHFRVHTVWCRKCIVCWNGFIIRACVCVLLNIVIYTVSTRDVHLNQILQYFSSTLLAVDTIMMYMYFLMAKKKFWADNERFDELVLAACLYLHILHFSTYKTKVYNIIKMLSDNLIRYYDLILRQCHEERETRAEKIGKHSNIIPLICIHTHTVTCTLTNIQF